MFSTSLRQRKIWSTVVLTLSRSTNPGWKGNILVDIISQALYTNLTVETKDLHEHDLAFPINGGNTFKICFISAIDVASGVAMKCIERLSEMNRQNDIAIIYLLNGIDATENFMKLQIESGFLLQSSLSIIQLANSILES